MRRCPGFLEVAVLIAGIATAGSVEAATRTIQFAGVGANQARNWEVFEEISSATCAILVANTGQTDQTINDMSFIGFQGMRTTQICATNRGANSTICPGGSTTNTSIAQTVYHTGSTANQCVGENLRPGEVCVIRFLQVAVPQAGTFPFCAGSFVVSDTVANQPGSVTAAGTIYMQQEVRAVGGLLTGALYLAPPHVSNVANADVQPTAPNATPGGYIQNMNAFCAVSCMSPYSSSPNASCTEMCGQASDTSGGGGGFNSVLGWLDGGGDIQYSDGRTGLTRVNLTGNIAKSGGGDCDGATVNVTGDVQLNARLRIANTHWAGGAVFEMSMGPMLSICSGNSSYWAEGGEEHTHPGSLDNSGTYNGPGMNDSSAPPERLLCAHRHGKNDLFMLSGMAVSFPINGGTPF